MATETEHRLAQARAALAEAMAGPVDNCSGMEQLELFYVEAVLEQADSCGATGRAC